MSAFWNKILENLASFKVWAFVVIVLAVKVIPGMNDAQAGVLTNLAYLAFGANVAIDAIKTTGEVMSQKYRALDPTVREPGVVSPSMPPVV